jgi:two-component system chemotaxis response regulator CheB
LPVAEIGPTLGDLARDPLTPGGVTTMQDPIEEVEEVATRDVAAQERGERRGSTAVLTCPDCGGVLWQVDEPGLAQFRCLAGHAYTGEELLTEQTEALERALWVVARGLGERRTLARQIAGRARAEAGQGDADRLDRLGRAAERHLGLIRELILKDALDPADEGPVREPAS